MTERYCLDNSVSWIVSKNAIDVFRDNRAPVHLPYPQAALWDLLSRRSKRDDLEKLLSMIIERNLADTSKWVGETLDTWLGQNLIREIG